MKVESLTNSKSIENTLSIPVGSCPIEYFPFFDNLMKSSAYLFERSLVVEMVSVENINVVKLESFQ